MYFKRIVWYLSQMDTEFNVGINKNKKQFNPR